MKQLPGWKSETYLQSLRLDYQLGCGLGHGPPNVDGWGHGFKFARDPSGSHGIGAGRSETLTRTSLSVYPKEIVIHENGSL